MVKLEKYEQAAALGNPEGMYFHATQYEDANDDIQASKFYDRLIEWNDDEWVLVNRASIYKKENNYPQAIKLYERAIRVNGDEDTTTDAKESLQECEIDQNIAKNLLELIWDELLEGKSFTNDTLLSLNKYCREDILTKLRTCSESTRQGMLLNVKHPLSIILNQGISDDKGEEIKLLSRTKPESNTLLTESPYKRGNNVAFFGQSSNPEDEKCDGEPQNKKQKTNSPGK
jgi:tetratricopeptide (TPR) repeat protein